MADSFQTMCNDYFARLKAGNKIRTSADTAKARDSNIAQAKTIKKPEVIQDMLKFDSPDIVSNFKLDMAVVKAYESVPKPTGKVSKLEHHFLMYEEGGNYRASKHFVTPENGGSVNYSCMLGEQVEWSKVVAAAHTHPLYNNRSLDRLNQYFSQGDPSILIIKGIPLFLRTPKGDQIKVLEVRDGWVTTRTITAGKDSQPKRWKAKG